jgi:hypothetical protein
MTRGGPAQSLRLAVDCLPHDTRVAMLEGVRSSDIIVGAYTDRNGGECPMLAAHRRGGRTSFATFARAWDRYTGARRARRASERELRTLETMLEASLAGDPGTGGRDFAEAIESLERARERRRRDTGERNRTDELRDSDGWTWLRPFRRYDHYAATLERLHELERETRRELSASRAPRDSAPA